MTEKQENILKAALKLFAEDGYAATSTSKVAKEAGVSEGLIFRHFVNKEGLLNAIMEQGAQTAYNLYASIIAQKEPESIVRSVISLPFQIEESQYHFWRLLYALKWQSNVYDSSLSAPLKEALVNAFGALNYPDPEAEAETILILIDGIATAVLLRKPDHKNAILKSILAKYNL